MPRSRRSSRAGETGAARARGLERRRDELVIRLDAMTGREDDRSCGVLVTDSALCAHNIVTGSKALITSGRDRG
jgi:hypothetical protein